MENDELMYARLSVQDARIASLESRLVILEQGGKIPLKRRRRELTPEERKAIRERLVKGQEAARARREAEAKQAAKTEKRETTK